MGRKRGADPASPEAPAPFSRPSEAERLRAEADARAKEQAEKEARGEVGSPAGRRAAKKAADPDPEPEPLPKSGLVFNPRDHRIVAQVAGRSYALEAGTVTDVGVEVADFIVGPDDSGGGSHGKVGLRRVYPEGHPRAADNDRIREEALVASDRFMARNSR